MILYTLACGAGHRFESWFRDSAAYEVQKDQGLVACTICRSTDVTKAIMAPAVVGGQSVSLETDAPSDVMILDERSQELRALFRQIRAKVIAEGDDVGAQFAAEARRMHDGDVPMRQIYGQASPDEAHDLLEEGIMILPMPSVPEELN